MTATVDGTPWIPVSTNARGGNAYAGLEASDCTYTLRVSILRFKGLGTYEVAGGDVEVDLRRDGKFCGSWGVTAYELGILKVVGSGWVTVTAFTAPTLGNPGEITVSGKIEGTFSFTLVQDTQGGPPVATGKAITNGRFGSSSLGPS